ncbi:MAG: XdhC family protein [Acidobacteriota bacterium]|nr:XdhC family protein [Acidobacteriota bacterium]
MSKEIQQIVQKINSLDVNVSAILATVVDVRGSSYRLPGAKMLILENGETFGTVSGGCLEADVLERAKKVLQTGEPSIFIYDTTNDENSVFSLNMGCRGVIRILLEPINNESVLLKTIQTANEERAKQVIGTLISADSDFDIQIGGRIFHNEVGQLKIENLRDFLTDATELKNDCQHFFHETNQISHNKTYQTEEGTFEFFLEKINPPISLLIFGAGADAVPVSEIGKQLGWKVSVIDHRPAFLNAKRFPVADDLILRHTEKLPPNFVFDNQTAAVIMTHNYERDRDVLANLLESNVFYIGALGPKRRAENLLNELAETGKNFSDAQLVKLFAPVGLDIGADTPEAIALSIVAEIQSVQANRAGGFLRLRQGGIYNRTH